MKSKTLIVLEVFSADANTRMWGKRRNFTIQSDKPRSEKNSGKADPSSLCEKDCAVAGSFW